MTTQPNSSSAPLNVAEVCRAFRLGMEGQANDRLTALIDALGQLMATAPEATLQRLNPLLNEVLSAMARKDHLWAADLLEYEIAPLISPLLDEAAAKGGSSPKKMATEKNGTIELSIAGTPFLLQQHWFWAEFSNGWEPETLALYRKFLPAGLTYVDIGAWIGPTLIYAHLAGAKQAHAVEANPKSAEMLRQNCRLNPALQNMLQSIDNLCIAESDGPLSFGTADGSAATSSASSTKGHGFTVQGCRLLDYLEKIDGLENAFIKIDIEGSELAIANDLVVIAQQHHELMLHLSLHPPFWDHPAQVTRLLDGLVDFNIYSADMTPVSQAQLTERCLSREEKPSWGTPHGNFFEIVLIPKGSTRVKDL